MLKSSIRQRIARCVAAAGLALSLALAWLAAPAAAQDDRFPAPGKDLAKILCEIFGGIFHDYGDTGLFVCQFKSGDITCDGKECWIVVPIERPPLKDECDFAGGKYGELAPAAFSCEIKEGVLAFHCSGKREWICDVGFAAAKDPQ